MNLKNCYLLCVLLIYTNSYSQTITVNSITTARQTSGDNGYTLDGIRMSNGSRLKLLNPSNFGPTGGYNKNVVINDGYGTSGSLKTVTSLPTNNIFFFGSFNKLDNSTAPFTDEEIDSLHKWSLRGGKVIIASGGSSPSNYDANILNNVWGYVYNSNAQGWMYPTPLGNSSTIFQGYFGGVTVAYPGGTLQGYFNPLTTNSKVLATNASGKTTLFMDCNTLDLIIADVDGYTDLSGLTTGPNISTEQDVFWANTIVFMDLLQPPPVLSNNADNLTLNSPYNNYQWFYNNSPIDGGDGSNYEANATGEYYVEVTLNGGCVVKSNVILVDTIITPITNPPTDTTVTPPINPPINPPIAQPNVDVLVIPNIFTPNNDGINDEFIPEESKGFSVRQITIYNRWGEIITKEDNPSILWNGNINNEPATEGVYFWDIKYQDTKSNTYTKHGFVHLVR